MYRVIIEREIRYLMEPRTIQDKYYFDTEAEARAFAAQDFSFMKDARVVSVEPYTPRVWWIVTYDFTGSGYATSPLRRTVEREAFATFAEAEAWARQPHPLLPNYCTLGIHKEQETLSRGFIHMVRPGTSEAARISDRCTDVSIATRR